MAGAYGNQSCGNCGGSRYNNGGSCSGVDLTALISAAAAVETVVIAAVTEAVVLAIAAVVTVAVAIAVMRMTADDVGSLA